MWSFVVRSVWSTLATSEVRWGKWIGQDWWVEKRRYWSKIYEITGEKDVNKNWSLLWRLWRGVIRFTGWKSTFSGQEPSLTSPFQPQHSQNSAVSRGTQPADSCLYHPHPRSQTYWSSVWPGDCRLLACSYCSHFSPKRRNCEFGGGQHCGGLGDWLWRWCVY